MVTAAVHAASPLEGWSSVTPRAGKPLRYLLACLAPAGRLAPTQGRQVPTHHPHDPPPTCALHPPTSCRTPTQAPLDTSQACWRCWANAPPALVRARRPAERIGLPPAPRTSAPVAGPTGVLQWHWENPSLPQYGVRLSLGGVPIPRIDQVRGEPAFHLEPAFVPFPCQPARRSTHAHRLGTDCRLGRVSGRRAPPGGAFMMLLGVPRPLGPCRAARCSLLRPRPWHAASHGRYLGLAAHRPLLSSRRARVACRALPSEEDEVEGASASAATPEVVSGRLSCASAALCPCCLALCGWDGRHWPALRPVACGPGPTARTRRPTAAPRLRRLRFLLWGVRSWPLCVAFCWGSACWATTQQGECCA